MKHLYSLRLIIGVLLLIFPATSLFLKGGAGLIFLFVFLISLWGLLRSRPEIADIWTESEIRTVCLVLIMPVLAVFASQAYHQEFDLPAYDGPFRYVLVIPILLYLSMLSPLVLSIIQYGFIAGAYACLIFVLLFHDVSGGQGKGFFPDGIHFGGLALLFGMMSITSLDWGARDKVGVRLLKFSGLLAGMYASFATGARGAWLAIPLVLLFVWRVKAPGLSRRSSMVWLISVLCVPILLYGMVDIVHHRVDEGVRHLQAFMDGGRDSAEGIRLQQWRASWHVIASNPWFGTGTVSFGAAFDELVQQGIISGKALHLSYGELHNDLLSAAVRYGVVGLLAALMLYLVPLRYFIRAARSGDKCREVPGLMGAILIISVAVYGFTVEFLNLKMIIMFYALALAVLLAAALPKRYRCDPAR
ncbi:MAG: O-antigen ligase family protein [Sideroxydans sp.]|nr:O-antigen ligase family protein [Sideroxydans sp.]